METSWRPTVPQIDVARAKGSYVSNRALLFLLFKEFRMADAKGKGTTPSRISALSKSTVLREQTAALTTTSTPATSVGQALAKLRPNINPRLYQGISAKKICTNGKVVSRILTISRGNFILFLTPSKIPGSNTPTKNDSAFSIDCLTQRVRLSPRFAKSGF